MANRFERALQRRDRDTAGATKEYREYDPGEAAKKSARAQFDVFSEDLREDMRSFRGRQVGAGRADTGFGFQEQDRFMRDRLDRLNRTLAQNAMRVADMRQRKRRGAARMEGDTLRLLQRKHRQDQQNKGDIAGTIGSVVGGASGLIPGTPWDPATGAALGGGTGRGIAGLF